MKASREVHAFARTLDDPVGTAVARAVGHAVATAHMADHCLGAALYALKAVKLARASVADERTWQNGRLPDKIRDLILPARSAKEKAFSLF
jgi:hypothetical protein